MLRLEVFLSKLFTILKGSYGFKYRIEAHLQSYEKALQLSDNQTQSLTLACKVTITKGEREGQGR
jgi:hypothetical protein